MQLQSPDLTAQNLQGIQRDFCVLAAVQPLKTDAARWWREHVGSAGWLTEKKRANVISITDEEESFEQSSLHFVPNYTTAICNAYNLNQ